ncbi:MAG: hypothetical protein ACSHX5_05410 [Phycisphaerales bacterium]
MKHFMLCAVAGCVSAAAAQSGSVTIVPSTQTVDWSVSDTFSLELYGDADFGTHIAGGTLSLSLESGDGASVVDMVGGAADWGLQGENDRGYLGNGDYEGLVFGHLVLPPFAEPNPDAALGNGPVLLGTVDVTINPGFIGMLAWSSAQIDSNFVLEIFDNDVFDTGDSAGAYTRLFFDDMEMGGVSVNVIPAPSGLALVGLGGLLSSRRRR